MSPHPGNARQRFTTAAAMTLLGVAYPVMAHVSALTGRQDLLAASIGLLVVLVLLPGLRGGRKLAWATLPIAALALYAVIQSGHGMALLFIPPVLINGFMAWVFGRTLTQGSTPLIERIVHAMHGAGSGTVTPEMLVYARHVTVFWAGLLSALTVVNLLLAALASPGGLLLIAGFSPAVTVPLEVWSLFANVLNYVIVAAAFVVEYAARVRRFPQQPYAGFVDFTRKLAAHEALFRRTFDRNPRS
jgi:uncharacterized membrane protein